MSGLWTGTVMTTDAGGGMPHGAVASGSFFLRCQLHNIHNAVKWGLREVVDNKCDIIAKVRDFVRTIRSSTLLSGRFRDEQLEVLREHGKVPAVAPK